MFRLLREILTKRDNQTFDEIKVSGFIAIIFSCAIVGYRVIYMNDQFDAYSFLIGVSWALGAMASGPALRDRINRGPGDQRADADRMPEVPNAAQPGGGRQL